jgi:flotillin
MGETRVASAERDKSIQVANARKEQSIGTRDAQREQAVRIAGMERDQIVGEKQANFERESQVKVAEQQMRVQVAEADATAIDGENQASARVAASQAELAIKKAEAYERGEGRRKIAEGAVLEVQNHALAKAALAEAAKVEAEQRAKLEAPAKAQKAKQIVDAEAAAEQRRILAQAEADAIYVKLEAEARGQYEILAKKGDGLKQIVSACGGSTQAFQMLMLEHLDNLADASARAISNIKFDKIVVWENGGSNGRGSTADFLSGMAKTLPPMMQVMRDIGGVELPESLVKLGATDQPKTEVAGNGASPGGPGAKEKGKA